MAAEGAGNDHPFHIGADGADALYKRLAAGVHSRLGPDEIVYIHLGKDDVLSGGRFRRCGQQVLVAVRAPPDSLIRLVVKLALLVYHPGQKQGGHDIDEAGAADALWRAAADGVNIRLQAGGINGEVLDGAFSGDYAVLYTSALKCRPGGGGSGYHPIGVADNYLAVGADVYVEGKLLALVNPRADDAGNDIPADIAGH